MDDVKQVIVHVLSTHDNGATVTIEGNPKPFWLPGLDRSSSVKWQGVPERDKFVMVHIYKNVWRTIEQLGGGKMAEGNGKMGDTFYTKQPQQSQQRGEFERKENNGALWKREFKKNDNMPDYSGDLKVKCYHCQQILEYEQAAWQKQTKGGKEFYSIRYQKKGEWKNKNPKKEEPIDEIPY